MAGAVDLIVNPASGPPAAALPRTARVDWATRRLQALGAQRVRATETRGQGDAAAAAARAVAEQVPTVIVWGGDGTMNEVAGQLIGSTSTLGVVPGGSGNGLARALALPLRMEHALEVALCGTPTVIDVGYVGAAPFFNIAGVGLDASVARRFNLTGGARRGMVTYLRACAAELPVQGGSPFHVSLDGMDWYDGLAHFVVVANGQQYGHGARIAPDARLDDGWFDVVVVPDVTLWRIARHGWRLFAGSITKVPGVRVGRARQVAVRVEGTHLLHLDGETQQVSGALDIELRERALRVRVPPIAAAAAARPHPQA